MDRRPPKSPVVAFTFRDGLTVELSATAVQRARQRQLESMAGSSDPILHAEGEAALLALAAETVGTMVAAQDAAERARKASKAKRPGRKTSLRRRIDEVMAIYGTEKTPFKTVLTDWQAATREGLRLEAQSDGRYRITDENGDAGSDSYKEKSLQNIYSDQREAE